MEVQKLNEGIAAPNQETLPDILKLTAHCYLKIFDWLSLNELIAVGSTCKHLQRMAGDFFRSNYAAKNARGENDGIYVLSQRSNVFSQYIPKISISGDRLEAYRFIGSNCNGSIKQFRFYGSIPDTGFEHVRGILNGIEFLDMNECVTKGEFYQNCLKYCPNVVNLSVSRSGRIKNKRIIIGSGNEWLLHTYPKLEHVELVDWYDLEVNELTTFFEQNTNVHSFATDSRSLWANRHFFLKSKFTLDTLAIDICQSKIIDSNKQSISLGDSIFKLLFELYERGFYKRLCMYVYFVDKQDLSKMFSLGALEIICGDIIQINDHIPNLKTLGVCYGDEISNIDNLPNKLPNLERVYFSEITSDRIVPFIRYSAKLQQIKIKNLKDGNGLKLIDFAKLNRERKQLADARKLAICVKEELYLEMKWEKNNANYSLIEFKRFETFEWEELNARHRYHKSM